MENSAKPPAPSLFEPSADYPQPLHGIQKRLAGWKLVTALAAGLVSVLVLSTGIVLGLTVQSLQSNLVTVALEGPNAPVLPNIGDIEGGFNVLVVGSDTRVGQGDQSEFVECRWTHVIDQTADLADGAGCVDAQPSEELICHRWIGRDQVPRRGGRV